MSTTHDPETGFDTNHDFGRVEDVGGDDEDPQVVELPPLDLKTTWFGTVSELYRSWRYVRKRRKLATNGYVQWYLIDGSFPTPTFVKPEDKGGGVPEYSHKGCRYLFPPSEMVPDEQQSIRTIFHRKGELDPIAVRDPTTNGISGKQVDEYVTTKVNVDPPGWLANLDVDAGDAVKIALALIILFAGLQGVLGGGMV